MIGLGAWLETGEAASAPIEMHRHANKAVPVGFTGEIGPKQMWERACPRCAARAALDLMSATNIKACTW
jgi:hypothetical protein